MVNPKIIPALADLTQDIAGPVPVGLLQEWASGNRDLDAAHALLEPFRIEGTVVASDTAGLSKLTHEIDLIRTLWMISRPKEVIHAIGSAIGGRAIGKWVADNTEMYYPASVGLDDIVQAMWEVRQRVISRKYVEIGMCVHRGSFYEIGGGLYGPDADLVEQLAEENARGCEILITRSIRDCLLGNHYQFARRFETPDTAGGVFSLIRCTGRSDLPERDIRYPHPYTDEFLSKLKLLEEDAESDSVTRDIYGRFLRAAAVVFIARDRAGIERDLAAMLDDLVTNALLETVLHEADAGSSVAKCGGGLAVLTFSDVDVAIDFVLQLREGFVRNGLAVRIGVDYGAVLFFECSDGSCDVAGDPVNMASKISEDGGTPGRISLSARAARFSSRDLSGADRFQLKVSGVPVDGWLL